MNDILKRNERELMKESELQAHRDQVLKVFELMNATPKGSSLKAKIHKSMLDEDEMIEEFRKVSRSVFRANKNVFNQDFILIFNEMIYSYATEYNNFI